MTIFLTSDADIVSDSEGNTWVKMEEGGWGCQYPRLPANITEYWSGTKTYATQTLNIFPDLTNKKASKKVA